MIGKSSAPTHIFHSPRGERYTVIEFPGKLFLVGEGWTQTFTRKDSLKDFCYHYMRMTKEERMGLCGIRYDGEVDKPATLDNIRGSGLSDFSQNILEQIVHKCDCPPTALRKKLREALRGAWEPEKLDALVTEIPHPFVKESCEIMHLFAEEFMEPSLYPK